MSFVSGFWIIDRFSTFTEYFGSSKLLDTDTDSWAKKVCQKVKDTFSCCYRSLEKDQQVLVEYVELQGLNTAFSEKQLNSSVSSLSSLEDDKRGRVSLVQR